jgi:hypothetical protein
MATRLIMMKNDGSVLVHSDGGSYKPLNWMSPPCKVLEGTSEDGVPEWLVTGKDDDTFVSTTESSIVVKAVANKDLLVTAKAKDSGDIAYEWKKKEKGSYGLGIDVNVKTAAREGAKK